MFSRPRAHLRLLFILILLVTVLALTVAIVSAKPIKVKRDRLSVTGVNYAGIVTYTTGTTFAGTEVGGLSGITYDPNREVYYVISDDKSEFNDARYYTVVIDVSDGTLGVGDVTFLDVTTILDENGQPFEEDAVDAEGIGLRKEGQIFISSEVPDAGFIKRFNWTGSQTKTLPIPDKFTPGEDTGIRSNLGFESLTFTPNGQVMWTGSENALAQDGVRSTITDTSPSRLVQYHAPRAKPMAEYVYVVEPIPVAPDPPGSFADNGLVELIGLDNGGTLLAMERSYAVGVGNTIKIFEIVADEATDVSMYDDGLPADYDPVAKSLVVNVGDLVKPDNLEGMTLGPLLPDGSRALILVSDNNFNPGQTTQFILLSVDIEAVSD